MLAGVSEETAMHSQQMAVDKCNWQAESGRMERAIHEQQHEIEEATKAKEEETAASEAAAHVEEVKAEAEVYVHEHPDEFPAADCTPTEETA